eukprot:CAMPEP_0170516000 /NCGR_PEP_ID=MMETSP0209-20121228/2361_1 /TAXON_ID=665100 ORGANISM="Litonotus pictus, Strain P1" /NCGR_SAMPLE_ID=MMETSP0209 /ASSEMBLY_ACC=CAM_ASM_000301 /LENGTH=488 /DNA_ID=CAMNT_0010800745 /DNA_START=207 /DNA_END=1673 /DNA_ORIENTATION=+
MNPVKEEVLHCFKTEDKETKRAKEILNERIKNLEFKYQGNLRRQNINLGMRGGKYYAEFVINRANVNPEEILNAVLHYSHKPQGKQASKLTKENFKVIDQSRMQDDDVMSIKIDYEVSSNSVEYGKNKGTVYIRGTFGKVYDNFLFILEKQNDFTEADLNAILAAYEESFRPRGNNSEFNIPKNSQGSNAGSSIAKMFTGGEDKKNQDPLTALSKAGVTVFQPGSSKNLDWGYIAGYETEKRTIEDTILLGLTHGEIYDQITSNTRVKFETNRPKAVLFEGPPGCGKTTSAKIIANQVSIPLIYMPLEAIMSKWYGESENKFSDIFEAAKALGKSIIFIDEIDALATSREGGIHEATRRILSTLLRKIDGFESDGEVLIICATNRRKDLDPALLSRLDVTITFDLPDPRMRALIFQKYAKQLSSHDLEELSKLSDRFSGRDIADVCKDVERRWASMYIRKEKKEIIPDFETYKESILQRSKYLSGKAH